MSADQPIRVEVDGREATVESMWVAVGNGYGHFTAMQVRDRKTRGMDFHLARLDEGTRALFGTGLDGARVRGLIRHALGVDVAGASVRVYVFGAESGAVMVTVREPASMPSEPRSLRTVAYQRPLAHIKHLGGFEQGYHGRRALEAGFDEALFVGPDDVIAEGSITNIGFIRGDSVIWPDAPALRGISMQVLERELEAAGIPWDRTTVRVGDLRSFDGAFITNARGIAPVGRIDDLTLPTEGEFLSTLIRRFDAAPWDVI